MDAIPAPAIPPDAVEPRPAQRVASVDVYRGFVMFLMMAEVLHVAKLAAGFTGSGQSMFWQALKFHISHVERAGKMGKS